MMGLSGEHLLVIVCVLLIFGPSSLPQLGSRFGKFLRSFKEGFQGVKEAEFYRINKAGFDKVNIETAGNHQRDISK